MTIEGIRATAHGASQRSGAKEKLVPRSADLGTRFTPGGGDALLTGVQAIARLLGEQHLSDRRRGLTTANFVSGYQGSPLGGVDRMLASMPGVLAASNTTFQPGLNEELAATAVCGSQIALPSGTSTCDGVVGYWYGKGPGLDRAIDTLRHANMFGVNPSGGAVVFVGDDPASKSSTVPAVSERTIASLHIPVLYPSNSAEVVRYGLHAVQISRLSGCVVAMKMTTDVAEGASVVRDEDGQITPLIPDIRYRDEPWRFEQRGVSLAPGHIQAAETDLFGPRTTAIIEYARLNELNPIVLEPDNAVAGILASGTSWAAVRQSFADMGVTEEDLAQAGIRVLTLGLVSPLDPETVRDFAIGLSEILVVEDKTPFIETGVRDVLYGMPNAPRVLGKRGREGEPLLPADGELTADRLEHPLAAFFAALLPQATPQPTRIALPLLTASRTPYFCSGCPHNRSTVLPEGSIGGGGIGCHTMVTLEARESSSVTGITQMGGEGAQWIGQAPFTDTPHIFQNVGDGTFFHSGQLALQACIAAGVNITYKVLFNEVVAMTGAQDAEGALGIAALTHKLTSEGVAKIVVCSDNPRKHRRSSLAEGTMLWHRDRLDEAQRMLRDTRGVTVLIYDQHCAADARRLRKRGKLATPTTRVVINEAVCEGCGDCGVKSNCLSVQPVNTELGRKTRIDQTSCNVDLTCLSGDCPSFITVEVDPEHRANMHDVPEPPTLPDPPAPLQRGDEVSIFMAGIGGTGIVTVNQVLATAAFIEGFEVHSLDQTGLSQKAGPVAGHLKLTSGRGATANRVSQGNADCLLAFDLLTATTPGNLTYLDASRTTAAISTSETPTGNMVYDAGLSYPSQNELLQRIDPLVHQAVTFDALAAANSLFGSTEQANFLVVGAALQTGALALSPEAVEEAITLNGVAVEANIAALRWGRAAVASPERFADATTPAVTPDERTPASRYGHLFDVNGLTPATAAIAVDRASRLIDYQNMRTADTYLGLVKHVEMLSPASDGGQSLSEVVARNLFTLTAYKDEYEVARLLTRTADTERAVASVQGVKRRTFQLHPPMLRAIGVSKKMGIRGPGTSLLWLLARTSWLRGTPFDVFGYAHVRKIERELLRHYRDLVTALAKQEGSTPRALRIAGLASLVKGYETVKLGNVRTYCEALENEGINTDSLRALLGRAQA